MEDLTVENKLLSVIKSWFCLNFKNLHVQIEGRNRSVTKNYIYTTVSSQQREKN